MKKKTYQKPRIKKKNLLFNFLSKHPLDPFSLLLSQCNPIACPDGCSLSCFLAGTRVLMANGIYKLIEDVLVGHMVTSYNQSQKTFVSSSVKKLVRSTENTYIKINNGICVTPFHRFWIIKKGWVQAGKLKEGMMIKSSKNDDYIIRRIERVDKRVKVYNLTLNGRFRNYFAENCLVHNTKCY